MTAPSADPLAVTGLSVRFQTRAGPVAALTEIDLRLPAGEFLVVVGESGSGKSVLASAILRALPANTDLAGTISVAGHDLATLDRAALDRFRRSHLAYIPQSPATALNPVRRVGSLLLELARARGLSPAAARVTLRQALAELDLDLDRIARRYPHQLSGGMQQRVLNALAMVGDPALVIADEPTTGLDADLVDVTAAQLRQLTGRGAGVLVITHDLRLAQRLGGRLALLYGGYLVESSPTEEFFAAPAHPYGDGLLAALPERGGLPIPGQPVELTAPPPGCPFEPRCELRIPDCAGPVPTPRPVPDQPDRHVRCYLPAPPMVPATAHRSTDAAR
ncbi:ABC transporter ATP-binding protein [Natronosporangium hydrolyticum]|uniref:Nickel import system ATP-binding protein NikD n=1 Tax=Natronosporangium hydrolyticum TaxID=2811111 RepID=A0A895YAB4_9ACTN|nr:ABC transporter ATP-binding protein [Natronosporangium hydrolyticum]QSB14687.1 ABC transporter ATP-binding protein [Natronosporangium hydrolyticum]